MVNEIKAGDVVFAFSVDGVESELTKGGRYLVESVDKKGEKEQDWYVNLVGVKRDCDYGFCHTRFFSVDLSLENNRIFKETVLEILNLPKSPALFTKLENWRAYKEAIESLIPALREA